MEPPWAAEEGKQPMNNVNLRKIAVIGCGFVGSASAFALMQSKLFSEIVLIDADHAKAEGEAMDISHGIPFVGNMKIYAGTYDDIVDAAIIVITAGAGQKPGETRLDLVHKNLNIFKSIIPEIAKRECRGILLVVANPVDILTYAAIKLSGFPEQRVIGSGTVLDTARLKYQLGEHLSVDSKSVHAFIIGEHGDSEIAGLEQRQRLRHRHWTISSRCAATTNHRPVRVRTSTEKRASNSAYEIIEKKRATYYGVAMAVKRICEVIIRDEKSILPISSMMHGDFGVDNVVLSMPAVVGADGLEELVPIALSEKESADLRKSADTLRGILDECGI